jgi:hypothetical protein
MREMSVKFSLRAPLAKAAATFTLFAQSSPPLPLAIGHSTPHHSHTWSGKVHSPIKLRRHRPDQIHTKFNLRYRFVISISIAMEGTYLIDIMQAYVTVSSRGFEGEHAYKSNFLLTLRDLFWGPITQHALLFSRT